MTTLALLSVSTAARADDLIEGKALYSKGNYNGAAEAFKRAIAKDGRNSTAHYYMANCYVAKHDWGEAKAEYQTTASLTKDEKVRDYCMTVIAHLEASHPAAGASTGGSGPSSFDKAVARGQAVMNRSQSESMFILQQAERECQKVMEEKNNALMPLQGFNYRSQTAVSTEEERQQVALPYDRRIEEIRSRAKARVDALRQTSERTARDAALQ